MYSVWRIEVGYVVLGSVCSSTPLLRDAVDIALTAQMYLAEGQYQLALQQFQASLGVLVPLLATEPQGPRKDLLYKQVCRLKSFISEQL